MSFFKFNNLCKKGRQNRKYSIIVIGIFFILMLTLNFTYLNNFSNNGNFDAEDIDKINDDLFFTDQNYLKTATDISMLQNPFMENFEGLRNFFINKYESSLDINIPLYFREGDTNGIIIDDTIYSEDNILMYNSLLQSELSPTETFDIYLKLKSTPLWYENSIGQFEYGFVKSVDNSTGEVKNDERYLVDNLLPIILLIENINEDIDNILINGNYPKDSIEEMFFLINSTEFWDETYDGFDNSNSTNKKYSTSNFYAILANLLIHRIYNQLSLSETIKDRAYNLANKTMNSMVNNMWDTTYKAFYYYADRDWDTSTSGQRYYHLRVNALGIITLLEFWVGSGMENDSMFLSRAVDLYNSLNNNLWNTVDKLYHNISQPNWNIFDFDYDLNANALMLEACIRLFQLTGNITYYDRAIEIFTSFETILYDNINNAYDFSNSDSNKNFNSNLKLCSAYLKASETYSSTTLNSNFNITAITPNFVFNQDTMNLTSVYAFERTETYYNLTTDSYLPFITRYNITDADITYILKYPNGTFLNQFKHQIISPDDSHTLIYSIEETLPIGDGYYIYIWANRSYFSVGDTIKRFNVFSGLISDTIEGLVSLLYQGPILNITLLVNYTRKDNLTLMASLEGKDIVNFTAQEVNFTSNPYLDEFTYVEFNLTARPGAIPGPSEIVFKIYQGNIIYLEVIKNIEIGYSFDYQRLIYQSQVVSGEYLDVHLDLINFLPNATQTLNVSFLGVTENSIEPFIQEETLDEDEIRSVSYSIKTLSNIVNNTIIIEMNILQNATVYYTDIMTVKIIPRFEILSASFPSKLSQGTPAYFISIIKSNMENSEGFTLYFNGKIVQSNINELIPGENRIVKRITLINNPYEFGEKTYKIIIEDSKNDEIARFYFKVKIELSTFNLVVFYLLPCIIPIGIILYFLNKQLKYKKLRR
ncbi:MAG: hypothetical protein ACFE8B_05400 [Candidatus Hermodarchaeota archaeon]